MESNIHFPTDLNLLWDSARKCLDVVDHISQHYKLNGWRKRKIWYKNIKKLYRNSANIHRKKGANYKERLDDSVKQYLDICKQLSVRVERSLADIGVAAAGDLMLAALTELLVYYHNYLNKHIDLVERRILKGKRFRIRKKCFRFLNHMWNGFKKGKRARK